MEKKNKDLSNFNRQKTLFRVSLNIHSNRPSATAYIHVVVESRDLGQWPLQNNSHAVKCYLKLDLLEGSVAEVDDCPCVGLPPVAVCHQINARRMCVARGDLPVVLLVDVQPQSVDSQPQVCGLLVLDLEVVDAVHFQILSNLQVLEHGLLPGSHTHSFIYL